VEPLDALTQAAARERIYLRSGDTHPNALGYQVIAESVAREIVRPAS
jgi:lysophospholipase L1-like esterase